MKFVDEFGRRNRPVAVHWTLTETRGHFLFERKGNCKGSRVSARNARIHTAEFSRKKKKKNLCTFPTTKTLKSVHHSDRDKKKRNKNDFPRKKNAERNQWQVSAILLWENPPKSLRWWNKIRWKKCPSASMSDASDWLCGRHGNGIFPKLRFYLCVWLVITSGRVLSDGWSALPWRQTQRFLHAVPHSVVMVTVHWHVHHKLSADCRPHQRPFWIGDCLIFWRENSVRFRHLFGIFRIPGCQSDKFPRRNLSVKRHSVATADKKKIFFFFFYKNEKCWKLNGNLLT